MAISAKAKPAKKKARQYVVNEKGERTGVFLSIEEYEDLVEQLEQIEDRKFLEKAKKIKGKPITLDELEAKLRSKGTIA